MKTVLMAGGFGTRLRPLTANMPKPMVPLGNKPIMEHTVNLLKAHGFDDLLVLLYFLPDTITQYFGDGDRWGVRMRYVTPAADLGTAGAVKFAAQALGEPILVISGDILTDFDLGAAVASHRRARAEATMVLTRVENPLAYGIVITDEARRVTRFLEKPTWGEVFSDTINTGIYLLEPPVLDAIPSGREYDFGKDLFPALLREGRALTGHVAEGYWRDVGDLVEYRLAHLDLLSRRVRVTPPGRRVEGVDRDIWLDEGARVDFTAHLGGAVIIGRQARVDPNARISYSVIGPGCVVGEGAALDGCVLWEGAEVGPRAVLKECVVGRRAVIGADATVQEGAVISDACRVGTEAVIRANVKVWPSKEVEDGATLAVSLVWGERWTRNLFGRYGITGLAGHEISPEFASKVGAALGAALGRHRTVITSRDHHKASRMINRALMAGLLSVGVDVQDLGVGPIPVVRYQIPALGLAGGTHARTSPYDPELLDIKVMDQRGMDLAPDREKSVERLFFREDFQRAPMAEVGTLSFPHQGTDRYRDGLLRFVDRDAIRRARFRLVLDYAFGSASSIFPSVLGELGVDVISLNAYLDEARISKTAEEFRRSQEQLSNIVRTLSADLGVLLDTGAEKLFLVDDKGEVLSGDLTLALVALLTMQTHPPGTIAVPVTASRVLEQLTGAHGFTLRHTRASPRALMEEASQGGMVFVGEERGGCIFPAFQPAFDAMAATVKLLEMMARLEVRLGALARSVRPSDLIRDHVPCPHERKGAIMRRLIEMARDELIELVEGVRVRLGEDWVAAIPDPDRALFHVIAEAGTRARAQELVSRYKTLIASWRDDYR
ncbi:MAG: NTP transferase domain-containing protein [Candidatus Rokubacteria bacterium]|nr:NTP transferase domain-containing protein [Candidatus Rokubacteria bacterium]